MPEQQRPTYGVFVRQPTTPDQQPRSMILGPYNTTAEAHDARVTSGLELSNTYVARAGLAN